MSVIRFKQVLRNFKGFAIYKRNQVSVFFRRKIKEQHQLTSVTASNRYPELFNEIKNLVQHQKNKLSMLSFGCSTGQECFSLRSYFPDATILGVDINRSNLRKANRQNRFENISFLFSSSDIIRRNGKYDAIFCLSVLCRWEDTKDLNNCSHVYSFDKFSETISMLADQVKAGGLLVVYNSNFNFEDTNAFQNFSIIETPTVKDSGFVHRFDSKNNRIRAVHRHCIYQKNIADD
jgi:2-polyprenyl-3-methyl-5-hydroxy-6-metoxy-1,4-benzoquinol methylase